MIGVVTRAQYTIQENVSMHEMGPIMAGRELVDVRKLEPTQFDASRFLLTDKEFPVYVENVRVVLSAPDIRDEDGASRSDRMTSAGSAIPNTKRARIGLRAPLQDHAALPRRVFT